MTRMDFVREWVSAILVDPTVSFAILLLGAAGVIWECAAPRWIVPGVTGLVLGVLALAALPKLFLSWLLVAAAGILIALAARRRRIWFGASWGAVLLTAAGLRWTVPLPAAALCSILFALLAAVLWRISFQAANKKV